MAYKFRPGQRVSLARSKFAGEHQGAFEIVRVMPEEHGINQYRIKSTVDGHERVATEAELSKYE